MMKQLEQQICDKSTKLKKYIEYRCYGRKELAEDLYSKALIKILTEVKAEKLKNSSSLDGFMGFCARSVISGHFLAEGRHKRLIKDDYIHCIRTIEKSPESKYEAKEEIKGFMKKVEKELGVVCRKIIMLTLFQNMDHYEIASTLGKDRRTISTHLWRMRKRFGNIHLNKYRELNT